MNLRISEADKKLLDGLYEDFKKVSETISDSEIVSFQQPVEQCVAFLSDYSSNDAKAYILYFTDGIFQKVASNSICFKEIPITEKIETYPYPLLLISDQSELDANTKEIVLKRCENGLQTFPVIIFPDNFFRLVYGESLSYLPIIEIYEKASGSKVIPFREGDIQRNSSYISSYTLYIACLARIDILFQILEQVKIVGMDKLDKAFLAARNEQHTNVERMSDVVRVGAICRYLSKINEFVQILEKDKESVYAALNVMRENYDKHINQLINGSAVSDISSFALGIDLKYGKLSEYIKGYLNQIQPAASTERYGIYSDRLREIVGHTRESLSTNSVKMSLIGTFSSGKTTLINTFLGKEKVLHTSAQHNTAVLMKLNYIKQESEEFCEFVYKDKLKWSILKPATKQIIHKNETGYSIRILHVRDSAGTYEILYETLPLDSTKQVREKITIRKTGELNVEPGSILKPGGFFIKERIISKANAKSTPASKKEIGLLLKMLKNNKFIKPVLRFSDGNDNLSQVTDVNQIEDILKKIYKIASEKSNTDIRFQDVLKVFSKDYERREHALRYLLFEAEMNWEIETVNLNQENWEKFFGQREAKSDDIPYSERPECYMLVKELHLYVHSEFLQYCAVTDTPGFGSVTEEHDATTERYIRDDSGRLLVMVAVNAKTEDGKYADLINKIDNIYNNYRVHEKKDVIFILNCFTNVASIVDLKNTINKVIKTLEKKGFNEKNIFVCDMKKAIVDNKRPYKMLEYPSYQAFHDFCVNSVITFELKKKYARIDEEWKEFFKNVMSDIEVKILQYQSNLQNVEHRKGELNRVMKMLKEIGEENDNIDPLLDDTKDMFEYICSHLTDDYKRGTKEKRRVEMEERLEKVQNIVKGQSDEITDNIQNIYNSLIGRIAYYGANTTGYEKPSLDDGLSESLVVLTNEQLKDILNKEVDDTGIFARKKFKKKFSEDVYALVQEDCNISYERIKKYQLKCREKFISYRNYVKGGIEQELQSLENPKKIEQEIRNFKRIKEQFRNMEHEFGRIRF